VPKGKPEIPADIELYLARLSVLAGKWGRAADLASDDAQAGAQYLDQAAARLAKRLKMKAEERTGEAPGTPDQVKTRLMTAFPEAGVTSADDRLRLIVPVRVTRAHRVILDVTFGAPAQSRVPVRLRGFAVEGRIGRRPTRAVTDRACAAIRPDPPGFVMGGSEDGATFSLRDRQPLPADAGALRVETHEGRRRAHR
jgi:hypothetical protein